jgi:hypothetical protein
MDQICLVVPILPGRTADARGFMPEPETGDRPPTNPPEHR